MFYGDGVRNEQINKASAFTAESDRTGEPFTTMVRTLDGSMVLITILSLVDLPMYRTCVGLVVAMGIPLFSVERAHSTEKY